MSRVGSGQKNGPMNNSVRPRLYDRDLSTVLLLQEAFYAHGSTDGSALGNNTPAPYDMVRTV